jgi:hypothetical protein
VNDNLEVNRKLATIKQVRGGCTPLVVRHSAQSMRGPDDAKGTSCIDVEYEPESALYDKVWEDMELSKRDRSLITVAALWRWREPMNCPSPARLRARASNSIVRSRGCPSTPQKSGVSLAKWLLASQRSLHSVVIHFLLLVGHGPHSARRSRPKLAAALKAARQAQGAGLGGEARPSQPRRAFHFRPR